MNSVLKTEGKILGTNFLLTSFVMYALFTLMTMTGGELVNWSYLGFELFLPFFTAVLVCENVKIRCEPLFDIMKCYAASIEVWILRRFLYVYLCITAIGLIDILIIYFIKGNFNIMQIIVVYVSTSLFLSSVGILISLLSRQNHAAITLVGSFWVLNLIVPALLKYTIVHYFYLFIYFASNGSSPACVRNKLILLEISGLCWLSVIYICKSRKMITNA